MRDIHLNFRLYPVECEVYLTGSGIQVKTLRAPPENHMRETARSTTLFLSHLTGEGGGDS
jgi:hypothetical protein